MAKSERCNNRARWQVSERFHVRVADDGRVVIPAALRRQLGLTPGSEAVIDRDGSAVRVRSYAQAVAEIEDHCRQFVTPGVSAVDELLAERGAEAAAEEAETATWLAEFHPDARRG